MRHLDEKCGVKLDPVKIGGRRYTSRNELQRFVEMLSQNKCDALPDGLLTTTQRSRRMDRVSDRIDRIIRQSD